MVPKERFFANRITDKSSREHHFLLKSQHFYWRQLFDPFFRAWWIWQKLCLPYKLKWSHQQYSAKGDFILCFASGKNKQVTFMCPISELNWVTTYNSRVILGERPLMTSDDFRWFSTYLPTMSDDFYLITSDFWESFWTSLPTLKSDIINWRSLGFFLFLICI